jgi:hypothetical protein
MYEQAHSAVCRTRQKTRRERLKMRLWALGVYETAQFTASS